MNIFYRILLTIYTVCIAAISVLFMVIVFNPSMINNMAQSFINVLNSNGAAILIFIAALLLFVMSISFLFSGLRKNKDKNAVSKYTNIGEIKISLGTIENIALNVTKKLTGIKEAKVTVLKKDEYVSILNRIIVMPDVNIPSLSAEIQARVKKSVEESSGVEVGEIKVIVDSVFSGSPHKARVE